MGGSAPGSSYHHDSRQQAYLSSSRIRCQAFDPPELTLRGDPRFGELAKVTVIRRQRERKRSAPESSVSSPCRVNPSV